MTFPGIDPDLAPAEPDTVLASEVLTIVVAVVSIVSLGITTLMAVRRLLTQLTDEVHRLALAVERIDTITESTGARFDALERRLEHLERSAHHGAD